MNATTRLSCAKIVLPTTETCRYRLDVLSDGEAETAVCDLLVTLCPTDDRDLCRIHRAACDACCLSFPPNREVWNPVIASLLQEVADRILRGANATSDERSVATKLRDSANAALEVVTAADQRLIPARARTDCYYWGEPVDLATHGTAIPSTTHDIVHGCDHPSHKTTTAAQCRGCPDWTAVEPYSRRMTLEEMVPPPDRRSGGMVGNWAVGVLTSPRRESTIEWCLDSLARAGWPTPHLFLDGLLEIPARYAHCNVTWRETPLGAWSNHLLSLQELVHRHPQADAFLLIQDDAFFHDGGNLKSYLENILWPGEQPGIVSLYCSRAYTELVPGWRALNAPWVWGALAFVFSPAAARRFITDPLVLEHRWSSPNAGRAEVDAIIGRWAAARGVPVWYPNPSLVQHVGNSSTIWTDISNTGDRRASWFAGDIETPFNHGSSLADFREERFPCLTEFNADYDASVTRGRERMRRQSVVICGLCRDVRHFLPRLAARIERLGEGFRDYRVVLFENDSRDATLEFLNDWRRRNDRVHVLSEELGFERFPQIRSGERSVRMSTYRNRYRDYAIDRFGGFDSVIVVDTDLGGGWSFDGIAHTFGQDEWDFVGSNGLLRANADSGQRYLHFDAWAFRMPGHPEPHENHEINRLIFERGQPLLPVLSCFGGLGVYRMEAFQGGRYGWPDIEHAVLHFEMRDRGFGRQFLNPSQIVLYSPE